MNSTKKEELIEDEEPIKIGASFVIKVFAIGMGVVTLILGIPYTIYKLTH